MEEKLMSNFVIDCINGDALMSEIDNYIDIWHESGSDIQLHDFLGMTKKEYELFVLDEKYLGLIIAAHKFGQDVTSVIKKEHSIAARSENVAKAKSLQSWLESEGLWE